MWNDIFVAAIVTGTAPPVPLLLLLLYSAPDGSILSVPYKAVAVPLPPLLLPLPLSSVLILKVILRANRLAWAVLFRRKPRTALSNVP